MLYITIIQAALKHLFINLSENQFSYTFWQTKYAIDISVIARLLPFPNTVITALSISYRIMIQNHGPHSQSFSKGQFLTHGPFHLHSSSNDKSPTQSTVSVELVFMRPLGQHFSITLQNQGYTTQQPVYLNISNIFFMYNPK